MCQHIADFDSVRNMTARSKVWLEPLRESSSQVRKTIFQRGPVDAVLTICELALNYIAGNLTIRLSKTQSDYVERLADRTVSLVRKRRFLVKPPGLRLAKALLST